MSDDWCKIVVWLDAVPDASLGHGSLISSFLPRERTVGPGPIKPIEGPSPFFAVDDCNVFN